MSRVIHFKIYTDDPETVRPCYQDVFGWKFQKFGGPRDYWLVPTGDGISRSPERAPGNTEALTDGAFAITRLSRTYWRFI
jgi:predicted enzyme related to lactoylglutathione lyase